MTLNRAPKTPIMCADETHTHHIGLHKVEWEVFNGAVQFAHRIRIGDRASRWFNYHSIATLTVDGKKFCATTEYWQDTLPRVFQVVERLK